MQITLNIEGKDNTFAVPFVSARMFRKTLEINKKFNVNDLGPEDLDGMVDYVVDLFKGQFSRDQLYDGLPADQLIPTVMECIKTVTGNNGEDPN